jgi:cell division protein FtsI (penicillin-binding protein 3)
MKAAVARSWFSWPNRNRAAAQQPFLQRPGPRAAAHGGWLARLTAAWRRETPARAAVRGVGSSMASRRVNYASSPLLASKTPPWRSRLLVVMAALGCVLLLARAFQVQVWKSDFYVGKGERRYVVSMPLPASRGQILDRNGNVLATSVSVPSVYLAPRQFREANADLPRDKLKALARLLDMPVSELEEHTRSRRGFLWLRRKVDEPIWQQIAALRIKGVGMQREFKRQYPEGETVAQVVGRTSFVDELGQEGVELHFQDQLTGRDGEQRMLRDGLGLAVDEMGESRAPVNGQDVRLSIDSRVQYFVWQNLHDAVQAHGARSGGAVVLDARTGEVLAMANVLGPATRPTLAERQRNRVLTDVFEPGSTMKPFIVAAAMQRRGLRPESTLPNEPLVVAGGLSVRDEHPAPGPRISLASIVARSSNSGTARLAMDMPRAEMHDWLAALGFGQKPRLEFTGVATGVLRRADTWRPIDQATMSYGYGVSASLLQLARAYTVFARDGEISDLSILRQDGPLPATRVMQPQVARQMREMLAGVTREGGTATRAAVEGYSVGGKTGTAQVHVKGAGYDRSRYRAWFVGLAPLSDPRLVVAVMVDDPKAQNVRTGGMVAAPIFARTTQQVLRTLGVPPDLETPSSVRFRGEGAGRESP